MTRAFDGALVQAPSLDLAQMLKSWMMQSCYGMPNVLNVSYAACQIFDLLVFVGRSARIGLFYITACNAIFVHALLTLSLF